jgi:putative ABC transport system permease protein
MWHALSAFAARLRFAWLRGRLDDESRQELDDHLERLAEMYARSGMTPDDARAAARRQLGNTTAVREEIYAMNGFAWLDGWTQDFHYSLRQLRHNVAFSAVVIGTLALGIGGTTAVFSVVQSVLLAPLPYDAPAQLVRIYQQEPDNPATRRGGVSATHFRVLREDAASFSDVTAFYTRADEGLDLYVDGHAQRLRVLQVTSDYFPTLGRKGFRGAGFTVDDEGAARRVVISDAVWRTRFNSDPAIIGSTIQLSAEPYEIAGIAPAGFEDPIVGEVDAWRPYDLRRDTFSQNYSLTIVGRLQNDVSLERASVELGVLSRAMKVRWPDVRAYSVIAVPLHEDVVGPSRGMLQLLLIAVALVLVVACANVANLVLVRGTARRQELAVRAAIGCDRARLVRQLLTESLVLATLGGVAGLVLAKLGVTLLERIGRTALPRLDDVGFDLVVLGFAALVTLSTAVAFGAVPAFRFARVEPSRVLGSQSRSATATRRLGRLRGALASAQLALALALMVGAGALLASFHKLQQVNLGFRVDRVLTFDVALPTARYNAIRRAAFHEELARRLESIPGVRAAGGISRLPTTGTFQSWPIAIESGPLAGTRVKQPEQPEQRTVSGNYFAALDIPLLAGRTFDERDAAGAPSRAVVSASFARIAFPGMPFDAVVGQRYKLFLRFEREIIGVVDDVTLDAFGARNGAVYSAHRQFADNRNWALTQVVAANLSAERIVAAVRAEVSRMDSQLAVHRATPMAEVVGRGTSRMRFGLVLIGTFAGVSLTLAAMGLYGVLSYAVRQRTQEIGIRIALGATTREVRALVLRQAAVVLTVGVVFGVAGAVVLGRWLSSLVFQVSPWDARIFALTGVVLVGAGLLAAWLPARRAARVDPRVAMNA